MREDGSPGLPGTLITLAPAPCPVGHLLRTAIDAEQVGATRIHLAADQPDLVASIHGIREHTGLLVTTDAGGPEADLADRLGGSLAEIVFDEDDDLAALVVAVAQAVRSADRPLSVGGRGASASAVLLSGLAAGAHVRVGTAETPGGGQDSALAARASGLARIAGRPPLDRTAARALLSPGTVPG